MREDAIQEIGIQEDVPLPVGVSIRRFSDDWDGETWEGYTVSLGGVASFAEYGMDPPPNAETVTEDLLTGADVPLSDAAKEDVAQIIEHLRLRGMVI